MRRGFCSQGSNSAAADYRSLRCKGQCRCWLQCVIRTPRARRRAIRGVGARRRAVGTASTEIKPTGGILQKQKTSLQRTNSQSLSFFKLPVDQDWKPIRRNDQQLLPWIPTQYWGATFSHLRPKQTPCAKFPGRCSPNDRHFIFRKPPPDARGNTESMVR